MMGKIDKLLFLDARVSTQVESSGAERDLEAPIELIQPKTRSMANTKFTLPDILKNMVRIFSRVLAFFGPGPRAAVRSII
jgi:hypothetical protein